MKTRLLICATLMALLLPLFAGEEKMPGWSGDELGPTILIYNGGRPWQGNGFAGIFNGGQKCRVRCVNSKYLDGFGGSTIKDHVNDKVEPVPFDGITPTMKNLAEYKLVIFHLVPENLLEKMLTEERAALLRTYVENGGNIIFFLNASTSTKDLLPVTLGSRTSVSGTLTANCPEAPIFGCFPRTLPVLAYYNSAAPVEGAEVLSWITDANGNKIAPYIARKSIGKGTVTFVNAESRYAMTLKEFSQWAYGTAFIVAIVGNSANIPLAPEKTLKHYQAIPERTGIGEVETTVSIPENKIVEDTTPAQINAEARTAILPNGVKLIVNEKGNLTIYFPNDGEQPFFHNVAIPQMGVAEDRNYFDASTAEATDSFAAIRKLRMKWKFQEMRAEPGKLILVYTAKEALMHWIFKSGKLYLDGRVMDGFAESVDISQADNRYLTSVTFDMELMPVEPLFARRFSCYSPPRGYSDFDMTGAKKSDTSDWSFFGSGQPFELLVCKDGIYMGNVEEPQSFSARMMREKDGAVIENYRSVGFGRVHAPVKSAFYWHWYGKGAERGHNDYLAMYQFQRSTLRAKAGLKEWPPYPMGHYNHLSPKEIETVTAGIRDAGYRYILIPGFETFIESTFSPSGFERNKKLLDMGLMVRVWSAGSYVQGNGGWIYNNHPEWFVRDKEGKIFSYGGRYPVIDVNNPDFYKWFTEYVKPAIESGIRGVYRDMDGAASGTVNYALKESPNGLPSQIKFYQFFQENNCRVSVEGMNPIVLDEYWYRPDKYTSLQGLEFALVGGAPMNYDPMGLTLDPFRLGMYAAFMTFDHSGTILGFERIPGEIERGKRVLSFVPKFNEALDNTGMPYVRETEFGTTWIGENGGALFFWNPTKKATINLPQGWSIKGVKGNVLTDVPGDSIYLLEKSK